MEYLFWLYFLIVFIVTISCLMGLLFNSFYKDSMEAKDIFTDSFYPQILLYENFDGVINIAGKIIVIIFCSLFLFPANIIIFILEIVIFLFSLFWRLFLFVFRVRK